MLSTCGAADSQPTIFDASTAAASGSGPMPTPALALHSGAAPLTLLGGGYRLCWCGAAPCATSREYRTDVGAFVVLGPSPLFQDRTCVSGQTCAVDGLLGRHLTDADRVLVAETCGSRAAPSGFAAQRLASASGAALAWGAAPVTAQGGVYRLCWCGGGGACSSAEAFRVDFGGLTIVGPAPLSQDRRSCGRCFFTRRAATRLAP